MGSKAQEVGLELFITVCNFVIELDERSQKL